MSATEISRCWRTLGINRDQVRYRIEKCDLHHERPELHAAARE
jgi:hypothetical protein